MKNINFFLISALFLGACQKEEEIVDLDTMVMTQEELDDKHLAGDPLFSPQELPLEEDTDSN